MGLPGELVAILAIGAIAMALRIRRSLAHPSAGGLSAIAAAAPAAPAPRAAGEEPFAVEADGHVWLPDRHAVHRFSLFGPDASFEDEPAVVPGSLSRREFLGRRPELHGGRAPWLPATLHAGDLTGARVVRGEPGGEPWRLEALGPEGEYLAYDFATRGDAETALGLLESRRVVKRPAGPGGAPIPAAPGDFEEARLRWERSFAELMRFLLHPEPPPVR